MNRRLSNNNSWTLCSHELFTVYEVKLYSNIEGLCWRRSNNRQVPGIKEWITRSATLTTAPAPARVNKRLWRHSGGGVRALSQSGHTIISPPMNAVIRSSNQISSIFDNPSYPNLRAHRTRIDKSNKVEQRSLCQLYLANDVLKTFRSHVRLVHPISFETTSSTHPSNHSPTWQPYCQRDRKWFQTCMSSATS